MVKYIIRKSIANGMRTKEDWQLFRKQQKAIEGNSLVEWAIEEDEDMDEEETDMLQEEQLKTAGRKADTRTLWHENQRGLASIQEATESH